MNENSLIQIIGIYYKQKFKLEVKLEGKLKHITM